MDGERKENPKDAIDAGDSSKSSEGKSKVKMQQSDVKEIKSSVPHTETAIKENETDVKELKIVTDGLKTEVIACESSPNELNTPFKGNNDHEVKNSQTVVTALKDLAQKAAGSVKDTESAIKEPKGAQSIDRGAKSETSISKTENAETDLVTKFEANIEESNVPSSRTKDVIKETETEIKDCTKKDSDSVVKKSDPGVKQSKKKDEVKQTDTRAQDIKISEDVSEAKSSKQFEEPMDVSVESDNYRTDDKKNMEVAMEIDAPEGSLKESKSETKAQKSDSTCSETVVQDSSTVAEVSEMECTDFDNSSATIVTSDGDTSIEKSDGAADISLMKEKQPVSKVESKDNIKISQTELKDTEPNNGTVSVDNTSESISETSNKVKEMQASVEKMKMVPEVSKSEITKTHESQRLSVEPKDDLKVKENKIEEMEKTLKESAKTETSVLTESCETDAAQSQNKVSQMVKDVLKPRGADTVMADIQHATPDLENSKSTTEVKFNKAESSVTTALASKPASVSEEPKKQAKMEVLKPVIDSNTSAVPKEQKTLPEVELVKPNGEKTGDSSRVPIERKKLPEVQLSKPDDKITKDSSVSKEQAKLTEKEPVKSDDSDTALTNASTVSKEQGKLTQIGAAKPDGDSKASGDASAALKEQKKLFEIEHAKSDGDKDSKDISAASNEKKKSNEVEHLKLDGGNKASGDAPTILKEEKKLTEIEHIKLDGGEKASRDTAATSKEQTKLTEVEHLKLDGGNEASRDAPTILKKEKKLTEIEHIKLDSGEKASRDTAATSKEQKKLTEVEHLKLDGGNKASGDAPTILKQEKKLTEIEHIKLDGGEKASRDTAATSKEQKKLTEVKHLKLDGGNKASRDAPTILKEEKKLTEVEHVNLDDGGKASRDTSAVLKEQKKLTEGDVKSDSGNKAPRDVLAISKEQKKLTSMDIIKPDNDTSVNASSGSEERENMCKLKCGKPDGDDKTSRNTSAFSKEQKSCKIESVKPISGDTTCRDASEDQKRLAELEFSTPNSDSAVYKDVQAASSVTEVSKLAEYAKIILKDVKHTEADSEQKNLDKSVLIKPESDHVVTMDVQCSEGSKTLVEEKEVKSQSAKTVSVDVQNTSAEMLTEPPVVKSDYAASMYVEPVSPVSKESRELPEAEHVETESYITNMDIELAAPGSEDQKKLDQKELVKPDISSTLSIKIQSASAVPEVNITKPVNTFTAHTKEPKMFAKSEEANAATMKIQNATSGTEESEKLTKIELAKLEGATLVSKDIEDAKTNTEEPQKLPEMEIVKTQNVDKVAKDIVADPKEQKRLSETMCMKSSAMKYAPKENKSEAGELRSVKGVEKHQIPEKPSEAKKAVTSEVSKIDNEVSESVSKGSKDEILQEEEDEEIVIHIDDDEDNEGKTSDVVEIKSVSAEKGKNGDSTKDVEECGSDDTYFIRASSATPELYMTQVSELEVSGTNGKHFSQATTMCVGDLEELSDSEQNMFASQSQAEDLDKTATPPYREFASASQHEGRVTKSSTTLEAESQDNEDKMSTSIKRKLETSDSSDAPESSVPPRKEPKMDVCGTKEEKKMEGEDDIVPAAVPEPKPGHIIQKSGSIPKLSKTAVRVTESVLEAKEVHNSPKANRKRPAEEVSPKLQCKLTFEDEPQKEPTSVRKKLKLNADKSETQEVTTQELMLSDGPEVEVLEPKSSRKCIEVVYMKQPSSQWSSTPTGQKERLEKIEECTNRETEDEEVKDEFCDSQDLVLRLTLTPSSQICSSLKANSPTLSNSTHKSEAAVSNAETLEETLQKENSNGHIKNIIEVDEPMSSSEQQNGESYTVIDLEKEDRVKLSENLKRKRGDTPVIELCESDSECDNAKTPDDKKRKRAENGYKDMPPLPLPIHLVKPFEMDEKLKKKQNPLEDDTASQNEREFFHKVATTNTNIDDVTDCEITVKREIKSETPFIKDLVRQIKTEAATCSNNWDINGKSEIEQQTLFSDIDSQNEGEFLLEDPVMIDKKNNSFHDDDKMEIKEEPWWLETETSSIGDNTKPFEMDEKLKKKQNPLEDDTASQNEREFFHKVASTNTNIDDVTDCEITVKTEIKSETSFIKDLVRQIESEAATCSNNCDINGKSEIEQQTLFSDIDSQNEGEFLLEDPVMIDKKNNSFHDDNKIEIKEEPWWLETETSSIGDNTKDVVLPPIKCSRLYPETDPVVTLDKSPLFCAEVPTRNTRLECDYQKYDVTCEGKPYECKVCNKSFSQLSDLNIHNKIHEGKEPHKCKVCDKGFTRLSNLKRHNFVHEGKKPHQCKVCDKSFIQLSDLKRHNFVHESKKPHQCKVCDKSFTRLSDLKIHNFDHEGIKPHQCKVCGKRYALFSGLKRHNFVHEGIKPHQCKVCDKGFTQVSHLRMHNLIHEGKKPHQCKVCDKSFTRLSDLKTHKFVHDGKKPHQCKVCDKSFTRLSDMKTHNFDHEGIKLHQCKVCDKSFTRLSTLKKHNLVHEASKPHKCKVCAKRFTHMSQLRIHNFIHEGKKPPQCKVCDKRFTRLSTLKTHNLVHECRKPHQCKVCDRKFTQLSNLKRHILIHEDKK